MERAADLLTRAERLVSLVREHVERTDFLAA
jgi:hypothetical protein